MANTFAANGFQQFQGTGASPTYEQTQMAILSTNTTAIFYGDPVVQASGTTGVGTGYITQALPPVALAISGIVVTTGTAVATFTALTTAPPIGSYVAITGTSFATGGGVNGVYLIIASSTTTITFNVGAAYSSTLTFGNAYVFTPIAGIFVGCRYLSTAGKSVRWQNYAPGSDYNGDVTAYVVNDPNAQFLVQTGNTNTTTTAVGISSIGQNIDFGYALNGASPASVNGNTSNGLSTYFADQYTLPANFPTGYTGQSLGRFRIIGPVGYQPGPTTVAAAFLGTSVLTTNADFTSAYNKIVVGFNNMMFKQLSGV